MIFHVVNYACLNRSDELNLIIGKLEKDNHIMTDHIEKADYIFVYTCGSTEAFIKRSYDATIDILKKHPWSSFDACYFIKIYIAVVKENARREKQQPKVVCPKM